MKQLLLITLLSLFAFYANCWTWKDHLHPVFHFSPPSNWMNDPNGLVYYNGYYHMFYQYNPTAAYWGDMHWGHAVSPDLINWIWLPPALSPTDHYDNQGIFSGSMTITQDGNPVIIYTGQTSVEQQCIAFPVNLSDPYLIEWYKYEGNPVIPQPNKTGGFRDPTEAWVAPDGRYHILVGSQLDNGPGCVFQWASKDLIHWEEVNIMDNSSFPQDGGVWECPDFFPIQGDTWVLKHSYANRDWWITGIYNQETGIFTQLQKGIIDWGIHYASKRFDANGRIIHFGWSREIDDSSLWGKRGWSGSQTVPREVTLAADGSVRYYPAVEVEQLRQTSTQYVGTLQQGTDNTQVFGNQLDIVANITGFDENSEFGFIIASSTKNSEKTTITFTNTLYYSNMFLTSCNPYDTFPVSSSEVCDELCNEDTFCMAWSYLDSTCYTFDDFCPISYLPGASSAWKPSVIINTLESSLNDSAQNLYYAPWDTTEQPLQVRLLYDHSMGELYVNGGKTVVTFKIYPSTLGKHQGVQVFANSDQLVQFNMELYTMGASTFVMHNSTHDASVCSL